MASVLNNQQRLICHKTQQTNQNVNKQKLKEKYIIISNLM